MKKIFLGLVLLVLVGSNLYAQDAANVAPQDAENVAPQDTANIDTQDATNVAAQDTANVEAQSDTNADDQSGAGAYAGNGFGGVDWQKFEDDVWVKMKAKGMSEAEFHQGMAYSYITKEFGNQTDRAVDHFKKAVKLDPNLYLSWYTLGLYSFEKEDGQGYFQKAIEANPDYAPSYYWLAYIYCQNSRDEEALPLFEKYLELAQLDLKEAKRISTVTKIVEELRSGEEGPLLKALRKKGAPASTIGQISPAAE